MPKHPVTIDDLFQIKLVSDSQISPDGKTIAFVQTTPDLEDDKYHSLSARAKIARRAGHPMGNLSRSFRIATRRRKTNCISFRLPEAKPAA